MMNFCKSIGLWFDCRSIIRARKFDMRASDHHDLFVHRGSMLATNFPAR